MPTNALDLIDEGIGNKGVSLELTEIIKVNQLVRNRIDFVEFIEWYGRLSSPNQRALIRTLFEFAYQAGVDEEVWREAIIVGGIQIDTLVPQIKAFHNDDLGFHDWGGFLEWLSEVSDEDRSDVFRISVSLFGTAEGKVFQKEKKEWCNHWWHRDLLDDRVVEAIKSDPRFFMTSMKDDDRIKSAISN